MQFTAIKTRAMTPPRDNLFAVLDESLPELRERDILVVTSKVVALHEGRSVPIGSIEKDELIRREADRLVPRELRPLRRGVLTIKGHTLVTSAGVDESNGNGHYILWPENPSGSAREIWQYLMEKHGIAELGVVITDSHNVPLRGGALGVAIGFWGFEPVIKHRGRTDIFGRTIRSERTNVPDALAAGAVLAMGEVNEQTPLCLIRGIPMVSFTDDDRQDAFFFNEEDDYYALLLNVFQKP